MLSNFKAEVRKLVSVRSTYAILGLSLLLTVFFSFFVAGWRAKPIDLANAHNLASQVTSAIQPLSLLFGLIAVLLVTHEYRYNTIVYALTSSRNRSKVLIAKFLAASVLTIVAVLFFGTISPILAAAGIRAHNLHEVHQTIPIASLAWRIIFAGWGFSALAFILAVIIRVQVGAITAMFLIPSTLENLLGLLLKKNQVYLPFSAINVLLDASERLGHISYERAAVIAGSYIVAGGIIAWVLFTRRDAS